MSVVARVLLRVAIDPADPRVDLELPGRRLHWPRLEADWLIEALSGAWRLEASGEPAVPMVPTEWRRSVTLVAERDAVGAVALGRLLTNRAGVTSGIDWRPIHADAVAESLADVLNDLVWAARQDAIEALTRANGAIVELNALLAAVASGRKRWGDAAARLDQLSGVLRAESGELLTTIAQLRRTLDQAGGPTTFGAQRALATLRTTLAAYDLD